MAANPERGEVEIEIDGEKGVLCAEMGRLASFSAAIGTKSLREIFERLQGVEPAAMFAAIDAFLIVGDARSLKSAIRTPGDLALISAATIKSLGAFVDDGEKKRQGEPGKP